MKKRLGAKKRISNEAWMNCYRNINNIITYEEVKRVRDKTLCEMNNNLKGLKCAYGYSGGKDSLVLSHLLREIGITRGMFVTNNLQYPIFQKWLDENIPKDIKIINTGTDFNYLKENPQMLFPTDRSLVARYSSKTHKLQEEFYNEENLDVFITGRRKIDGNVCGPTPMYKKKSGMCIYNPLRDWTHEELLGYIYYFKIKLPPIYEFKNGFVEGSHPWYLRSHTYPKEKAWEEIYEIDKSIVYEASKHLESAKEFLNKINNR